LTVVYTPNRNPLVQHRLHRYRQGLQCGLAPKQAAARSLVKALSLGESVGLLVDQRVPDGVLIPFFGRPAPTTVSPARLALKFGASIVPTQCQRLSGFASALLSTSPFVQQMSRSEPTPRLHLPHGSTATSKTGSGASLPIGIA